MKKDTNEDKDNCEEKTSEEQAEFEKDLREGMEEYNEALEDLKDR